MARSERADRGDIPVTVGANDVRRCVIRKNHNGVSHGLSGYSWNSSEVHVDSADVEMRDVTVVAWQTLITCRYQPYTFCGGSMSVLAR